MSRISGNVVDRHHRPDTCEMRDLSKSFVSESILSLFLQVGPILDKVEQMVEEQSLDPVFSDK